MGLSSRIGRKDKQEDCGAGWWDLKGYLISKIISTKRAGSVAQVVGRCLPSKQAKVLSSNSITKTKQNKKIWKSKEAGGMEAQPAGAGHLCLVS
jgi:hypothetical protein